MERQPSDFETRIVAASQYDPLPPERFLGDLNPDLGAIRQDIRRGASALVQRLGSGARDIGLYGAGIGMYVVDAVRGSEPFDARAISHTEQRNLFTANEQKIVDGATFAQDLHETGQYLAEMARPAVQSTRARVQHFWRRYVDDGSQYFK